MSWTHQTLTEMQTEEPVRDVASVDSLQKRHEGMKSEIDAREELFASVVESGRAMIQASHYDSNEVTGDKQGGVPSQYFSSPCILRPPVQAEQYSGPSILRPHMGPTKCSLILQVVLK